MTTPQVDRVAELTAELEQERKWHYLEGWPCARELPPRPRCACNGEYRCPGPHTPSAP